MDDDNLGPNPLPCHITQVGTFAKLDFGGVDLPSNRLTIQYLRKHFHSKAEHVVDNEGHNIDTMWDIERTFVLLGYAAVLGKEAVAEVYRAVADHDKNQLVQDYSRELIRFGLADGPVTAREIIKGLESAGAAIAKQQLGQTFP